MKKVVKNKDEMTEEEWNDYTRNDLILKDDGTPLLYCGRKHFKPSQWGMDMKRTLDEIERGTSIADFIGEIEGLTNCRVVIYAAYKITQWEGGKKKFRNLEESLPTLMDLDLRLGSIQWVKFCPKGFVEHGAYPQYYGRDCVKVAIQFDEV